MDGTAFPVLPKDYFGDALRGVDKEIKEKTIQYIFKTLEVLKTLKAHLTPKKKTARLSTMRQNLKSMHPSRAPGLAGVREQADNGTGRSTRERLERGECSL